MLPPIIVYFHICQNGPWHIPFDMIMSAIKSSGLYDSCIEIRAGIVNDVGYIIPDERFNDPKIKLVAHGPSSLYERVTLSHMWNYSKTDNAQYLYVHSKGIGHFAGSDEHKKNCVTDWINLLIHWNIHHWRLASEKLMSNDVYGCEICNYPCFHFSGNFWWANSHFIRTLPEEIGPGYCDPEFWLFKRDKIIWCNIFSSGLAGGSNYFHRFIKGIHY